MAKQWCLLALTSSCSVTGLHSQITAGFLCTGSQSLEGVCISLLYLFLLFLPSHSFLLFFACFLVCIFGHSITCYVDQAGLKLLEICHICAGIKGVRPPHPASPFFKRRNLWKRSGPWAMWRGFKTDKKGHSCPLLAHFPFQALAQYDFYPFRCHFFSQRTAFFFSL